MSEITFDIAAIFLDCAARLSIISQVSSVLALIFSMLCDAAVILLSLSAVISFAFSVRPAILPLISERLRRLSDISVMFCSIDFMDSAFVSLSRITFIVSPDMLLLASADAEDTFSSSFTISAIEPDISRVFFCISFCFSAPIRLPSIIAVRLQST